MDSETTKQEMITELTQEQRDKMPEYVDKWIKVGTDTNRLDYESTKKTIDQFRELIGRDVDVPLKIVNNPIEAWVACCLIEQDVRVEDLDEEIAKVFNGNPSGYDIPQASLPWQTGSFHASTFSFYDFIFEELGVELDRDLWRKYKVWEATVKLGCIYPLDNATIVCEKPTEINLNENNVLHKDGGPALTYAGHGDFKIYSLNGVEVPEWLAVTPEEDLDVNKYSEITNADVKAEFVRKVGVERFVDKGKKLDSYNNYDADSHPQWYKSQYELIDMGPVFMEGQRAPYLQMVNGTTGIFHLEGVSPECQTVRDALKERFGGRDFIIKDIA